MNNYVQVPIYINASGICFCLRGGTKIEMWCGKVVVFSNYPSLTFCRGYKAGVVVDPRKIEDMASEIVNLLLNSEMRREIGLYGRKYVMRHCEL